MPAILHIFSTFQALVLIKDCLETKGWSLRITQRAFQKSCIKYRGFYFHVIELHELTRFERSFPVPLPLLNLIPLTNNRFLSQNNSLYRKIISTVSCYS